MKEQDEKLRKDRAAAEALQAEEERKKENRYVPPGSARPSNIPMAPKDQVVGAESNWVRSPQPKPMPVPIPPEPEAWRSANGHGRSRPIAATTRREDGLNNQSESDQTWRSKPVPKPLDGDGQVPMARAATSADSEKPQPYVPPRGDRKVNFGGSNDRGGGFGDRGAGDRGGGFGDKGRMGSRAPEDGDEGRFRFVVV